MNILDHKGALAVVGATLTAASGLCWGYIIACRELEDKFDAQLEATLSEEVDKVRRFYATRYKDVGPEAFSELDDEEVDPDSDVVIDTQNISIPKEALATPEGRAAVMAALQKHLVPTTDEAVEPDLEPEPQKFNAFDRSPPEVDLKDLIESRSVEKPYVISKEEFERNDAQFEVFKLTFFDQDGGLLDEDDQLVPDTDLVVGDENLRMFGILSENNNIVYVQNDRTETIYEVVRDFGSAHEAIFGVPEEEEDRTLSHSSMKRRRSRRDDE